VIRRNILIASVLAVALLVPGTAQADFGIVPGSVEIKAQNQDGTPANQASSHPYSLTVDFDLNTDGDGHGEGGEMRDAIVQLPPGLVGNPLAVPRCPHSEFSGVVPTCPPNTQVGVLRATAPAFGGDVKGPIYNMVPPPGMPAQLAFGALSFNSLQATSVRSEDGYGVQVDATGIPVEVTSVTETIWGVPAVPSHDAERGGDAAEGHGPPVKSDAPVLPFLTLPANCDAPLELTVKVDSKLTPGVFDSQTVPFRDGGGNPAVQAGCDGVPFAPKFSAQPTTRNGASPSGLDFELKLPNQGLLGPGAIAETEPRKTVVTLPQGVTVNPSLAEGIGVCTPAQYALEKIESPAGAGCPGNSKLGSVVAQSPLLGEAIEGAVYLAAPYDNPFNSLTALYLVARAPERSILVKQAGKVELDPATGQIKTTFDNLPPVPYSSFKLHFREGARAPLATPAACGSYESTATFTPFSAKDDSEAITKTASFQIEGGADGSSCPSGGLPPFRPGLIAGTTNNAAGRFSPFNLRLFRSDSEQEFTRFSIKLPPGVAAKLAGIPSCSDAAIAAAAARTGPRGGNEELAAPSCPAASQVGRTLAGAGVGSALAYAPGKVYLAGPYNGHPLSVVAITAGVVGPFDVGTVLVRLAIDVNPEPGEVFLDSIGSDPIPHIIKGIPLHVRDIRSYVDRPNFTFNPTSCEPTSTSSTVLGSGLDFVSPADDNPFVSTSPFQAADCAALPFAPKLGLRLIGSTKRGGFPKLKAFLQMRGFGEAGVARAQVTLPKSEFIANAHFNTICTRVQFKAAGGNGEACPAGAAYGWARAKTPVLSDPLEGPVFLRSSEHELPDVVASLRGAQINGHLVGHVDSVKGKLRTTFETVPDAPVEWASFSFKGNKKGLFENSTNLCVGKHRATVKFSGQNGKHHDYKTALKVKCKGKAQKRTARAAR